MSAVIPHQPQKVSLISKIAGKYSVEPTKLLDTLKATAFKVRDGEVSNEQMMALLVVADQYGLNPFTKELFAFPDKAGIVPVVGVDGWARIINEHTQFDGMDFEQDAESCTCIIHRKDRAHPTRVTEYLSECRRDTSPWKSHPTRMLRHKAMIQCARLAFGFAGIYDQDEAERIREVGIAEEVASIPMPRAKSAVIDIAPENKKPEERRPEAPPAGPAAAEGKPLGDAALKVIKDKMAQATLTELDLKAKFSFGFDGLTDANYGAVMDWIANPAG